MKLSEKKSFTANIFIMMFTVIAFVCIISVKDNSRISDHTAYADDYYETTTTTTSTTTTERTTTINYIGIYNGNIQYRNNGTTVEIIECKNDISGEFEIPETIDGLPVTDIGGSAFSGCSKLDSIILTESIKNIYKYTFNSNLKRLIIKNPECTIYAHWNTIPESTVIYGYADSTAQQYAQTFNREFVILDGQPIGTVPPTTTTPPTTPAGLFGDINSDGIIDAGDASAILAYYAYTSTGGTADLREFLTFNE